MKKNSNPIDEGYIKFNCDWINTDLPIGVPLKLKKWRDRFFELKQIGYDDINEVGYGNISVRLKEGILISGTQTGHIYPIQSEHFTLVIEYKTEENKVVCMGKIKASSETMTHATIYENGLKTINAVIHVHNKKLWENLKFKVPTTKNDVPYGTPEMANEISRLFKETNVYNEKIIVMAGHEDGVIVFGENIDKAAEVLLLHLSHLIS